MLPWHLVSPEANYSQTNTFFLMEMFVLSYVNTLCIYPRLCLQVGSANGSEPTWQTSMLYSDIVPLIYVNKTICMVICPSTRFKSIVLWPGMNYQVPFWVLRHSFLSINRLLMTSSWRLTGCGGTLSAPFWCLCQKLSLSPLYFNKIYYTKVLSNPVSGPRSNSSPPEAKNPSVLSFSNNLSGPSS